MKRFASTFVIVAAAVAIIQWWQIAYRLRLFYVGYKGELNVNHIGDVDFILIHAADAALLLAAAVSLYIFRHEQHWRKAILIIGSVNLAGWLALILMHQTGILVEYHEFLRYWRSTH